MPVFNLIKHFVALVVIALTFPVTIQAQVEAIYIDQGVTFPGLFFTDVDEKIVIPDSNRKVSYLLDIGLRYKVLQHFHVVTGLMYEERGWFSRLSVVNSGSLYVIQRANFSYPFLSAPVLIEYSLGTKLNVFLNGGFNFSYRLGKKLIDPNHVSGSHYHPEYKSPRWDISWTANAGFRIPIKENLKINLKANYYRSYSRLGTWGTLERITHHKGFRLSMGLLLNL